MAKNLRTPKSMKGLELVCINHNLVRQVAHTKLSDIAVKQKTRRLTCEQAAHLFVEGVEVVELDFVSPPDLNGETCDTEDARQEENSNLHVTSEDDTSVLELYNIEMMFREDSMVIKPPNENAPTRTKEDDDVNLNEVVTLEKVGAETEPNKVLIKNEQSSSLNMAEAFTEFDKCEGNMQSTITSGKLDIDQVTNVKSGEVGTVSKSQVSIEKQQLTNLDIVEVPTVFEKLDMNVQHTFNRNESDGEQVANIIIEGTKEEVDAKLKIPTEDEQSTTVENAEVPIAFDNQGENVQITTYELQVKEEVAAELKALTNSSVEIFKKNECNEKKEKSKKRKMTTEPEERSAGEAAETQIKHPDDLQAERTAALRKENVVRWENNGIEPSVSSDSFESENPESPARARGYLSWISSFASKLFRKN